MSIFYEEEHKTCYNYELPDLSVFKYFDLGKSSPPVYSEMDRLMLCFVGEGSIEARFGLHHTAIIEAGNFFLVPSGVNFYGKQLEHAKVLCCSFSDTPKFCNLYTLETLVNDLGYKKNEVDDPTDLRSESF